MVIYVFSQEKRLEDAERHPSPPFRVFQTPIIYPVLFPRVQEPAAIRPSGFQSFRLYLNCPKRLALLVFLAHLAFLVFLAHLILPPLNPMRL